MKITSAQDVIDIAEARGFVVRVKPGPPPMPVLTVPAGGDKKLASPSLLEALRSWRLEIIDLLEPKKDPGQATEPDKWPLVAEEEKPPDAAPAARIVPPPGAKVYLCLEGGRECGPEDECYMWTWSGAEVWYFASQHPPPERGIL